MTPLRERLDRRVLGAVQVVSGVTGLPLDAPVVISGATVVRNRRGDYVLMAVDGTEVFDNYLATFDTPPTSPTPESIPVTLRVDDLSGRYLPRLFTLALPRSPNPTDGDSIFVAHTVPLFPSPAFAVGMNWALVRVAVRASGTNAPLAGALIQVINEEDTLMGAGMSDERGEALVAIAGLKLISAGGGNGNVTTTNFEVTLRTIVEPDAPYPPNPDVLAADNTLPTAEITTTITPQRTVVEVIDITL